MDLKHRGGGDTGGVESGRATSKPPQATGSVGGLQVLLRARPANLGWLLRCVQKKPSLLWLNRKLLREDSGRLAWDSFWKDLVPHAKESELDPVSDKEPQAGF